MATVVKGTVTKSFGYSAFSLKFNDEVKVKKTSVDKFSFMDSLNFFGSNLGLWPGLGLYQILESMVEIFLVSQILKKIRSLMYCSNQPCRSSSILQSQTDRLSEVERELAKMKEEKDKLLMHINYVPTSSPGFKKNKTTPKKKNTPMKK